MEMLFQSLIDIDLWNTGGWHATVFMHDPEGISPPGMGLVFRDIVAGKQIFADLRTRLGEIDKYEELRISIIEDGEVQLENTPGYFVHIASNPENTIARLAAEGSPADFEQVCIITRMNRMTPDPGSPHLPRFKKEFSKHGKFFFLPVSADFQPILDLSIEKTEIHFRKVADLTKTDLDSAVLPEEYFGYQGPVQ